jgi:hypothetical protein
MPRLSGYWYLRVAYQPLGTNPGKLTPRQPPFVAPEGALANLPRQPR